MSVGATIQSKRAAIAAERLATAQQRFDAAVQELQAATVELHSALSSPVIVPVPTPPEDNLTKPVYRVAEVVDLVGSEWVVRKAMEGGELRARRAFPEDGSTRLILVEDLRAWLRSRPR